MFLHGYSISSKIKHFIKHYDEKQNVRTFFSNLFSREIEDTPFFFFFSVKDRNLFHRVDTIVKFRSPKEKNKYSVYFMLLTLSGSSFVKIQYISFPLFPVAYPYRIATHYNITSCARNVK